jgi:PAS domain S-box-containing protein
MSRSSGDRYREDQEPSLWDRYKWAIGAVISLCLIEALLIVALLAQRAKRRRAERGLGERLRFETLLSGLSSGLIQVPASEVEAAIERGLAQVVEFLGVDRGNLHLYVRRGEIRRISWAVVGTERLPGFLESGQFPWAAEQTRRGRVVRFSHLQELPLEAAVDRESYARVGTRSHVSLPLRAGGPMLGVLSFDSTRSGWWCSDELVDRLRLLSEIFASALARRRAEQLLAERLRFETLLSELSAAFTTVPAAGIDAELERWQQRIVEFLGIDRSTVAQLAEDGTGFRVTHSWAAPGLPPARKDIAHEKLPWVVETLLRGEVIRFSRLDDLPAEAARDRETLRRIGLKSGLTFPLEVGGAVIGLVAFGALRRERDWPDDLVQRLKLVGEIFANALLRKRAHEELERVRRFQDLVSQLSTAFISVPAAQVDAEIHRWLQRIGEFLGIDRCIVAQLVNEGGDLRATHAWATPAFRPVRLIPRQDIPWMVERVLRGEVAVFSRWDELPPDAAQDRETFARHGITSNAMIPLAVGGSVIGAVGFGSLCRERAWPGELVQQLQLVGEIFANALMRRRAHEQLETALRFQEQVAQLSAAFVAVPPTEVDREIERWLQRIADFLEIDRSFITQLDHPDGVRVTHACVIPGFPRPATLARHDIPWLVEKALRKERVAFARLEDLPPEAARDRATLTRVGVKSQVTIPLTVGGTVLGWAGFGTLRRERFWPEELVQRLRLVGEIFANALMRQRAEAALRQSEDRLRVLLESTQAIPWEADAQTWQFAYVGPQAATLLGYPLDAWYTKDFWTAHLHPEDREFAVEVCLRSSRSCADYEFEYRMISAEGRTVWIQDIVSVQMANGEPSTLRGFMIDITARKRAEARARASENRFRQFLDSAPDAIILARADGTILLVNRQTEQLFGYGREELIGRPVEMLIPERWRGAHGERFLRFAADPRPRLLAGRGLAGLRKDGSEVPVEISLSPIESEEGVLAASIIRDISERRRVEEEAERQRQELAHVSRLTVMGELAASLAHELNQPLTAILSNAQAAQRFLAADGGNTQEVQAILEDIVADDKRAGEVIRGLRGLLKRGDLEFASVDLNSEIRSVIQLVRGDAIMRNVSIILELDPDLPPVRGDRVQLQQVVLNLVVNGLEAFGETGTGERTLVVRTERAAEHTVRVAVRDAGSGIPLERLRRMFEPFYTTKREGLGMGLSICRSILERHGGRLWATNNPNRGATLHFSLPLDDGVRA